MMMSLIIKSYLTILLSVALTSVGVFILGLYFILRRPRRRPALLLAVAKPTQTARTQIKTKSLLSDEQLNDFTSIAGEDVHATQLDLARAYIETGKTQLAKKMLIAVQAQGSSTQQQEALQLLSKV